MKDPWIEKMVKGLVVFCLILMFAMAAMLFLYAITWFWPHIMNNVK